MKEPYILFQNIKKARVSSELSQKELAKKLGISDKTVSAYETGRAIPPTPTLAKIAEITKVSMSQMMGTEPDEKSEISKRLEKIEATISYMGFGADLTASVSRNLFVGVVLRDDKNRIYLIRKRDKYEISRERWNLPGGSVDNNESLIGAATRETKEKTGYKITVTSLLGSYKCKKGGNSWIFDVFDARLKGKKTKPSDTNVTQGKWFSKKEFLNLKLSQIVHSDMKLVYKIAQEGKGLEIESVKYIDYDKE